ncbi:hypothetical protein K439DRAFT_1625928 [Ramaria rubella]|nr:hypothetical protein K439DRAFT_1625928 [Ramaria rubella]
MERDPPLPAANDLPTYDELAAQHGPNSRFGRWKGWVEKRAAERYAEDTPERREARRMKGWGPRMDLQPEEPSPPPSPQPLLTPLTPNSNLTRTQTVLSNSAPNADPAQEPSALYITVGQALPPTHLKLRSFGSRFLPHSEEPILSLLPLFGDKKLLIGRTNGLSVLDMESQAPLSEVALKEPRRRDVWHGEGVYQMALLEAEQLSTTGTPQGVVLALVGAEAPEGGSDKDSKEPHKTIRMYNLASLASVACWAAARETTQEPLDLSHPTNWQPQVTTNSKKHKQRSMSRGSKSQKADSLEVYPKPEPSYPFLSVPPPPPPKDPTPPPPKRPCSSPSPSPPKTNVKTIAKQPRRDTIDSGWDVIGHNDLPLRWAADFVPLASPGSRLANQSVLFFELYRVKDRARITAHLAIATKQNILLYETVRGERAFRFVKEFYTPIPAQSAMFIYQSQTSTPTSYLAPNTPSTLSSRRASSPLPPPSWSRTSVTFTSQLSLFVVFEKKAGLIRISDSAVGEIDLWEGYGHGHSRRSSSHTPASASPFRRSIGSLEGLSITKDWKGPWIPPAEITLTPTTPHSSFAAESVTIYLLTRGKRTHIVPSPLPMPLSSHAPLKILEWGSRPTRVVPRSCEDAITGRPFLQVTALGEEGVEVQELSLSFLNPSDEKGKGKAHDETVIVQAEVGPGGAGFLCAGGHWSEHDVQRSNQPPSLQRHESASTVDTVDVMAKHTREQGFYAWTQKGYSDWRVFWLGGDSRDEVPPVTP